MTTKHDPNWGGARPGAGPKPKTFTIRLDQQVLFRERTQNGPTEGRLLTVIEITKTHLVLSDDTGEIVIRR